MTKKTLFAFSLLLLSLNGLFAQEKFEHAKTLFQTGFDAKTVATVKDLLPGAASGFTKKGIKSTADLTVDKKISCYRGDIYSFDDQFKPTLVCILIEDVKEFFPEENIAY